MSILNRIASNWSFEERERLNQNWSIIENYLSNLQNQIRVLSGEEDVTEIIDRLNNALTQAESTLEELHTALIDATTVINNAQTATDNANDAAQGALNAITDIQNIINDFGSKGEYDNNVSYKRNNIVYKDGCSYIYINEVASSGNTPPPYPTISNAHWHMLADKGANGSGAVSKVNGKEPNGSGEITLISSDIGAASNENLAQLQDQVTTHLDESNIKFTDTAQYISTFKTNINSWSDALEDCINYCISKNIKKIKLPKGELIVDRPLSFSGDLGVWDLIFEGDGKGIDGRGTSLKYAGTGHMLTFDLTLPTAGAWRGLTFRDMSFRGNDSASNNGIKAIFGQMVTFENCNFISFNNAITLTGNAHYSKFENCIWTGCEKGIYIPDINEVDYVPGDANNGSLINCMFTYCNCPVYMGEGSGWTWTNVDLEGENGFIVVSSCNTFINVRVERNKNAQKWIHIKGDENKMQFNINVDGGHQPTPLLQIDGDYNEIELTGKSLVVMDETSTGRYNTIKFKKYGSIISGAFIRKVINPNYYEFTVRENENLADPALLNWTNSGGITINESTFSDSTVSYQLSKTGNNPEESITHTLNGDFKAGDTVYLKVNKKSIAGGGWLIKIGSSEYDINTNFLDIESNTNSILEYYISSDTSTIDVKIECVGATGSAIEIGGMYASNLLSSGLIS